MDIFKGEKSRKSFVWILQGTELLGSLELHQMSVGDRRETKRDQQKQNAFYVAEAHLGDHRGLTQPEQRSNGEAGVHFHPAAPRC